MPRPSEPVLTWLRTMITKRGLNTAALATATQLDRNELRKALTGTTPMTLDMLMVLSNALELSPADMGLVAPQEPIPSAETTPAPSPLPDPWGNHTEQLFRIGFALGCDFFFVAEVDKLGDSGVPAATLKGSGKDLPIELDARFHTDNAPRFDERGITLTLSFDKLYDCCFPWSSIRRVIFFPAPPEALGARPDTSPQSSTEQGGSASPPNPTREKTHLRLVTDE